ncbi:SLIT and NTRK-like protein 2 [Mercenaria mercenaria]|uniref:SLIT and NTRK-like protein 2 n=1 Tax=Mercenaria mercenaria TaxID=6596 RepID=UPI001E1DBE72|nr:SLIT and NTRK-like protein 2 [Mercenaria mercenaria]
MSAPAGCTLSSFDATCSFSTWSPPLIDNQFSTSPGNVIVNDIDGTIPSDAFSGLANSGGYTGTPQLSLDCGFGNNNQMTLLSDSLSSNLSWVENMLITDCYDMEVQSGAFSVFTGLTILTVIGGNFTTISGSAFSGMTSLTTLYLYAGFPTSGIPSGLLDGLTALTSIDMSRTALNSIPSGLFDGLTSLTSLQLLDSSLTTLPSDLFYPLISLTTLDISENSWECDCQLQWLGTYLTATGLTTDNCSSPASLAGFDLSRALLSLSCSTTSTSDDNNENWYHYGLIAGTSLAFILALIAIIGCLYQRMQYEELVKSMQKSQTAEQNGTTKITNIKSNQESKNAHDLSTEDGVNNTKDKNVWTVSNEEINRHQGSPFNKRSRQVMPSRSKVQRGWASQRDPDEW